MKRSELDSLQPLEEILPSEAVEELHKRQAPCARTGCDGTAVVIGYVGHAGYPMVAYECEVCGEVEVRR